MKTLFILFLLALATPLLAAPNLGVFVDVEGVRVYQDHEKKNLWYLTPAAPDVSKEKDKSPDFGLEIYRYLGRRGTGRSESFSRAGHSSDED